jgi:5-formyltetrahydrofolate cyclo-ligase
MAVPRLAGDEPFVRVAGDPTIKRALAEGAPVRVEDLGHVDLVVSGTVAVNRAGVRIGKGGGYSDLELGLLVEAGLVDDATTIVTTVHPLQILDEQLPETAHDFRVDIIVTPDDVIRTDARRRSPGVIWEHLDDDTIQAIPVLAARRPPA